MSTDTTQEHCLTLTQLEVYCSKKMVYDMIRIYNPVQDLLKLQMAHSISVSGAFLSKYCALVADGPQRARPPPSTIHRGT